MADQFLGFDLSTQQLKGIVVGSDLKLIHEAKVDFDADLSKYGIEKGVLTNPEEGEVFAPVALFLEAIDLVLQRLKEQGADFSKVQGISGAGMQHGTVFWSKDAETLLGNLDAGRTLLEQLEGGAKGERKGAFSHPFSPNWQDASTQKQCEEFDAALGGPEHLALATGSSAHHRFSGPQIQRFRQKHPQAYKETARISLISSFLASIFLGKVAPMDISDICGANLWDIKKGRWQEELLALTAGGNDGVADLKSKLGEVPEDGGSSFGAISPYFTKRYGFPSSTQIIAFTGDNPSTILALPLRASDAIVSLGTSTTFLMSTPQYKPDSAYHFMNHPTTAGLYMFMLCYKNGGLAREHIRDAINKTSGAESSKSWDTFNERALSIPPLGQKTPGDPMRLGLFFPRPEIVPNVSAGTWRFLWQDNTLTPLTSDDASKWSIPEDDARAILESQFLSLRLRSQSLVSPQGSLPPQPRRVYLVGGGAVNHAIAELAGQVLGGSDGVYKLEIGGNACALGAAYKAAWGVQRNAGEKFEDFLEQRWNEEGFVKKICEGYRRGVWEGYGEAVRGLEEVERWVVGGAGKTVGLQGVDRRR
ncbi:similar to D-xylulose kinase [Plenodomus lingam JN3]|uniref:Xylulose kinase n=1 Tax=Leptosphaeria maculans (strain JN3 / isolate v23.1.3 / race Av1-4-5-6-7-8) TaxID=985895 RepID=E4ZU74_LEPMJ|nr:similar to D-xylulose kinase [Plenodomus lingam JN3]CBX94953.1 similar to D-xylulose kinase [Plenodomus lingam JN3]